MAAKRAVITGATGFSGRHLVRYLQSQGLETVALSSRDGLLGDYNALCLFLRETEPNYIFHLAGVSSGDSAEDYFRVNVLQTQMLLRATRAERRNCPILIVGSGAEYGSPAPDQLPLTEEGVCKPFTLYGISKLTQTFLGLAEAARERRPIVVARPFNIIGLDMPEFLALGSFRKQLQEIKRGMRPPILHVGGLTALRDFIDIDDVVRLYWQLIQQSAASGEVFNLCTGIPISVEALLGLLIETTGMAVEVRTDSARLRLDAVPVHYGSNNKIHRLLGAFSYTPIADTIRKIAP